MMIIVSPLLKLTRPLQWLKNLMLFFPPFLSGSLLSIKSSAVSALTVFIAFCSVASALYIINDICDAERDAAHPAKRLRPIPSGDVSRRSAIILAIILAASGLLISIVLVPKILVYILLYATVTICYSLWLKNIPVVDLFCICSGFIIRLLAGGLVFNVEISEWLLLTVFFLSLFLSSGKRLAEQNMLGATSADHRASLGGYPEGVLDAILNVSAATVLVTYTMYSLAHPRLLYTVPLCTFGLFRYIVRVKNGSSGDPTESLLKDVPLLCVSIAWVLLVGSGLYR